MVDDKCSFSLLIYEQMPKITLNIKTLSTKLSIISNNRKVNAFLRSMQDDVDSDDNEQELDERQGQQIISLTDKTSNFYHKESGYGYAFNMSQFYRPNDSGSMHNSSSKGINKKKEVEIDAQKQLWFYTLLPRGANFKCGLTFGPVNGQSVKDLI